MLNCLEGFPPSLLEEIGAGPRPRAAPLDLSKPEDQRYVLEFMAALARDRESVRVKSNATRMELLERMDACAALTATANGPPTS